MQFCHCAKKKKITSNQSHHRVRSHTPRWHGLLHSEALWQSLFPPGYKPVQHVTAKNTRVNQAREKDANKNDKHELYEAAACVTQHPVSQQTFF